MVRYEMSKEIIISVTKTQTRIALVENDALSELYVEGAGNTRTLGDLYLGRIKDIRPSLRAAFVDVGLKQHAFLHFSDLAENMEASLAFVNGPQPRVAGHYPKWEKRIQDAERPVKGSRGPRKVRRKASPDLLKRGQRILVRISKEPIASKGCRVSTSISLAGRFLVLVPLASYAAISKKISSPKERRRLRDLTRKLKPEGFGVIVRTVAEGMDAKALEKDMRLLLNKWQKVEKRLAGTPDVPIRVHSDVSMASSIVRDLFSDEFDRILVDNARVHRNIKSYIQAVAPQMLPTVQLYKGERHIFETCKLDREINQVFDSHVDLPSGGYIIIERTEAMHVVDVNSGRAGRGMRHEEGALKVNLEAARVLAKQIRLRDLGGIIVVDFIDLKHLNNRKKVLEELTKQFEQDRAVTRVLPMSDFGLIQITRQRLRPSLTATIDGIYGVRGVDSDEQNPGAAITEMIVEIERSVKATASRHNGGVRIRLHPFAAAYLKKPFPSWPTKWRIKHRVRIELEPDPGMEPTAFQCGRIAGPQHQGDSKVDVPPEGKQNLDASPRKRKAKRGQRRSARKPVPDISNGMKQTARVGKKRRTKSGS